MIKYTLRTQGGFYLNISTNYKITLGSKLNSKLYQVCYENSGFLKFMGLWFKSLRAYGLIKRFGPQTMFTVFEHIPFRNLSLSRFMF